MFLIDFMHTFFLEHCGNPLICIPSSWSSSPPSFPAQLPHVFLGGSPGDWDATLRKHGKVPSPISINYGYKHDISCNYVFLKRKRI